MNEMDYWLDRKTCFSCGCSKLAREKRDGAEVLYCEKCGVINACVEV